MGAVTKLARKTEQETEVVQLTPALAAKYLEANTKNRSISESTVESLADEMTAGRWKLHHQGIAIDTKGELRDGQHRLAAIVKSGVTVPMLVTTGIDPSSFDTIDAHRPRTVGDQLILFHGIPQGRRVAAMASVIHNIEMQAAGGIRIPVGLAMRIYKQNKAGMDFAVDAIQHGPFSKAPIVGVLAYGYPKAPEKVAAYTKQIRDGERLTKNDPAYVFREMLLNVNGLSSNLDRRTIHTAGLRCMHAFFEGEKLSVIRRNQLIDSETYEKAWKYFQRAHVKNAHLRHVANKLATAAKP